MSMGINLLLKLLKEAAKVLAPAGYDMELVEKHHNQKLDAPSGTALALADSMNEALDNAYTYVYDRSQARKKRDSKEIGISAVRAGTIVGEHEVFFAGTDEVIEFKHTAYSRSVFAKGAVEAAKFLKGKTSGMYDMGDVIDVLTDNWFYIREESMKELETKYLERLSDLYPTIAAASYGNYQPAGNFKPAQRNGTFPYRHSRRIRSICPCFEKWFRFCQKKDR